MVRYIWCLILLPLVAVAQGPTFPRDITFSWINASEYTDGTLIESGDLVSVDVDCFRNDSDGLTTPEFSASFPVNGVGLEQSEVLAGAIPRPGTYTCFGYSVVSDGTESVRSAPDDVKHVGQPLPPASFLVE